MFLLPQIEFKFACVLFMGEIPTGSWILQVQQDLVWFFRPENESFKWPLTMTWHKVSYYDCGSSFRGKTAVIIGELLSNAINIFHPVISTYLFFLWQLELLGTRALLKHLQNTLKPATESPDFSSRLKFSSSEVPAGFGCCFISTQQEEAARCLYPWMMIDWLKDLMNSKLLPGKQVFFSFWI